MKTKFKDFLLEYKELADKIYFKTNKLSEEERKFILNITNGDNFTKIITDLYYFLKENKIFLNEEINKTLIKIYNELKDYNKNVFPVKNFNNINKIENIQEFYFALLARIELMKIYKKLPSVALRNLKNDIRTERNSLEMKNYKENFEYFSSLISYLNNRNDDIKEKILNKLFKNNMTLNKMIDFLEEKSNLIGGIDFTKDEIIELVNDDYDMKLLYNKNNILLVQVETPEAIKKIGCNSLWCFTYGQGFDNAYRTWSNYSTNDIVYVIIDFNLDSSSQDFMYVIIKPINFKPENDEDNDEKMYDLTNEPVYSVLYVLKRTIGIQNAKKLLTFEYE